MSPRILKRLFMWAFRCRIIRKNGSAAYRSIHPSWLPINFSSFCHLTNRWRFLKFTFIRIFKIALIQFTLFPVFLSGIRFTVFYCRGYFWILLKSHYFLSFFRVFPAWFASLYSSCSWFYWRAKSGKDWVLELYLDCSFQQVWASAIYRSQ